MRRINTLQRQSIGLFPLGNNLPILPFQQPGHADPQLPVHQRYRLNINKRDHFRAFIPNPWA
nr:hypothetical protein [Endozoicomonas sp. YOMI1]